MSMPLLFGLLTVLCLVLGLAAIPIGEAVISLVTPGDMKFSSRIVPAPTPATT